MDQSMKPLSTQLPELQLAVCLRPLLAPSHVLEEDMLTPRTAQLAVARMARLSQLILQQPWKVAVVQQAPHMPTILSLRLEDAPLVLPRKESNVHALQPIRVASLQAPRLEGKTFWCTETSV